jgi:hypothetical protein
VVKLLKQYSNTSPKQKYFFWSIIVFAISLFALNPSFACFSNSPIIDIIIVNLVSHISSLYIYFLSGRVVFKIKNNWPKETKIKIAKGFQYPFIIGGVLFILLSIYESIKIGNYHSIKDVTIGIALLVSSLEKIKKIELIKN